MRLCVNCKYHDGTVTHSCHRVIKISPVTGEIFPRICGVERSTWDWMSYISRECGKSGRFYEKR